MIISNYQELAVAHPADPAIEAIAYYSPDRFKTLLYIASSIQ
jgi:hypothetical protein